MSKLNVNRVRDLLQDFKFQELFIEELGWNNPGRIDSEHISIKGDEFAYNGVASLGGIETFEVRSKCGAIPERAMQLAVSREVAKVRLEHVLIFVDEHRTQSVWFWVKRDGAKRYTREHHFFKGQPGDLFISKIAAMSVDLSELDPSGQLPLVEAAKKVQNALDVERVIKTFYRDYDNHRIEFTRLIQGVPDGKDRAWYASVLLNRLMFVYFLQKQGFLDYHSHGNDGDRDYLENKLAQSHSKGRDRYYSEFLQVLFFEAFAKPQCSADARALTGNIKYLNGGLFLPHRLETKYDIQVPDEAFENLLRRDPPGLFRKYSWHLNDVPGASDNDINPDVMGYIFEKYINQKEFGAYYTRPEITEYLCERTIFQLILDRTSGRDIEGLPPAKKYESVPELLVRLDTITARQLLGNILPKLTILDPAVGSGAFLVAALKTLVTVYSAVVGWLEFNDPAWLKDHVTSHMSSRPDKIHYAIKKAIITDNLYGVDIMEEATEIARLRLFMALVASAKTVEDLEPLPNIDFNILTGNSLVGLTRVDDEEFERHQRLRDKTGSLFAPQKTYREILNEREWRVNNYRHAAAVTDDLISLREGVENVEKEAQPVLAELLEQSFTDLGVKVEEATWDTSRLDLGKPKKRAVTVNDIQVLEPFHWGFEFDRILNLASLGGFDAIITNPPWEAVKPYDKEFLQRYSADVSKRKMTQAELKKLLDEYMLDSSVRTDYLSYISGFSHQSAYFRIAPEYSNQSAIVDERKTGTDVNLYKLFVERCYHLLRPGGLCGIVTPSGIYSDLGTTGLRRLLFANATVTGLFCFENRKEVFEGVHRSFKFSLLSYRKAGKTESFPAAFMRHEVSDLDRFPESVGMEIAMETIRALSPDTLSVVEFQHPLDAQISSKMLQFPTLGDVVPHAWKLKLATEFHMTINAKLFLPPGPGKLTLYEGKMIWQFEIGKAPPRFYVNATEGDKSLGRSHADSNLSTFKDYRLAFRDITGNTNERTMVATVLPQNVFTGNTLVVSQSPKRGADILVLVAMLNSFVLDYSLRQRVKTHMNMFYVYSTFAPRVTHTHKSYVSLVRRAARLICVTQELAGLWNEIDLDIGLSDSVDTGKRGSSPWRPTVGATEPNDRAVLRSELDALVAHLYTLTEEEFRHVLSTFPLVDPAVRDAALAAYRSVAAGRIT